MWQKYFPQVAYLKEQNRTYLDSSATTLKLKCVKDTLNQFYDTEVANVHRGDHYLSDSLTQRYEGVRTLVKDWIKAESADEIIFTTSTTESLNLLSFSLQNHFKEGDTILLTEMEHHSNLLPWQALAKRKKLNLKFVPVDSKGCLKLDYLDTLDTKHKIRLFAFTYYSNALGVKNPVPYLIKWAQQRGILTVVDAAQAITAKAIDVRALGCDFLVFSPHKMFAPSGTGVLYARQAHFNKMTPWQLGGGMVSDVSLSKYTSALPPQCFEAGTPAIEGVLAFGAVLKFLTQKDFFKESSRTKALLVYAEEELQKIPGLRVIGDLRTRHNILSFVLSQAHCRDVGQIISQTGVAIRTGHHCCIPLMKRLNCPSGTVRASFSVYNDEQDVEHLVSAVKKAKNLLL